VRNCPLPRFSQNCFDFYSVISAFDFVLMQRKAHWKNLDSPSVAKFVSYVVCTFVHLQCRRVYKSSCMVEDDCECSEAPLTCENRMCQGKSCARLAEQIQHCYGILQPQNDTFNSQNPACDLCVFFISVVHILSSQPKQTSSL